MKRNLDNFTRGSQLLGHFSFMFAAGIKGPAIIAVIVLGWMSWWMLSTGLSDNETYLIWMRAYAAGYTFMEFDPHKEVAIETVFGATIHLPISAVQTFPPVLRAWGHMVDILEGVLLRSALLLVPAFVAFYWFAARFGLQSAERKHERGALLTTLPRLIDEIRGHNKTERARELSAMLGWRWRLCRQQELDRVLPYRPSRIAQVTYPWRLEQSHVMLIGTTGMGKTVALSDMIEEARRRGQRAVIFDLTGTFIEHFYEASRDVILNPLDARCPQWSVFDECRDEAEFTAAAEAIVPHDGGGSEQFWVLAARLLFVEMCLKLRARGGTTNAALADELMTADLAAVHSLMQGTIADPLTAPEAARIFSRCVDECGHSRREIVGRSDFNKEILSRMLAGTRDVTLNDARDIVIPTGRDAYATMILLFYERDEFELLWREPKALGLLTELRGAFPNPLRHQLGGHVEELRPGIWSEAGTRIATYAAPKGNKPCYFIIMHPDNEVNSKGL
jgi:hypothetical protein